MTVSGRRFIKKKIKKTGEQPTSPWTAQQNVPNHWLACAAGSLEPRLEERAEIKSGGARVKIPFYPFGAYDV